MRAHAIVIGIDHYPKPEWCLTGAVRDAVAFARWCVTAGGVAPKDLTLHLSPRPNEPSLTELLKPHQGAPDLSVQAKPATHDAIARTFHKYRTGAGKDAERLWFYYAGHGLSAPAAAPNAGPLLVPADEDDLDFYVNTRPLGLETFRGSMEDISPKEQFFFVDACRDVLQTTASKVLSQQLLWDVRSVDDDKLATQNVFLATTAGQRAKEIRGHGLFSRALLAALRGLGPQLKDPDVLPKTQKELYFNDLVEFVTEAVKHALQDLPGVQPADLKGVPYARANRITGNILIAEFDPNALPTAKIGAILEPAAARPSARIEFLHFQQGKWIARTENPVPVGPPVPEVATFEVCGGKHPLRITAQGFEELLIPKILVYEDKRFPIELRPISGPAPQPPPADEKILEAQDSGATATVIVRCHDRLARVAVVDARGKELGRGYEEVRVEDLIPGPYSVSAELTSTDRVEQTIYLHAGQTHEVSLDIVAPPVSPALKQELQTSSIFLDGNYSHPSENFGPVANTRLGSILAYAAWAARWPVSAGFHRLRAMGVDPMPSLESSGSALQVLVGDVAETGAPFARSCLLHVESVIDSPLQRGNVIIIGSARPVRIPLPLTPLQGFAVAQQASLLSPAGPIRLHTEMPGFAPASFALTLLRGFVTTLVISREADGEVDVQQYFNPIDPSVPVAQGFEPPLLDDVRLVELAWRALQGRDTLDDIEYSGLLEGKRSNPLLGIIAGYRMFRTEREHQFRVTSEPPANEGRVGPSPLWNMVYLFPGLPDVHVLAGLYDPERRDEHFQRAMNTGTPVMVEGFWTLVEWLTEESNRNSTPPPKLGQSVLPGMVWTSFTDTPRAELIGSVQVITPTGRSYAGSASDDLVDVARSVGRLETSGEMSGGFLCTGFLVAPQLLLCPIHFAISFAQEQPDGRWAMQREARVRFELGDTTTERTVIQVVRTLRPPRQFTHVDGGMLDRAMLDKCWPVLLLLSEPAAASPLVVASEAPEIGQRVAVIGFPRSDARLPSSVFAHHFAGSAGEKHVMSGSVLRSPGTSWTLDYDCFTADGTSGGPVVDMATGTVVGMHVAASRMADGRKRGVALAMTRFSEELRVTPPRAR